MTKVKVLPSPFNNYGQIDGTDTTIENDTIQGEERSWPPKGRTGVNSVLRVSNGPRTPHQVPTNGRYFVGIDWFEATLLGEFVHADPEDPEKPVVNSVFDVPANLGGGVVKLVHNQLSKRSKHYRYGFDVLLLPPGAKATTNVAALVGSYKIGVLSAVPHQGNNCVPRSSIFQVENHLLYRSDLWEALDGTFAALGAEVSHLTRLDLAVDGMGLLTPADDYFRDRMDVAHGHKPSAGLSKVGKASFQVMDLDEAGQVESFYIGSRSSKKLLNGYAKGRRIEIENKQYIREAWRSAGLITGDDEGRDVTRLEMRHKKKALDELHLLDETTGEVLPFDWEQLRDPVYLVGVVKETLRNFYAFKVVSPTNKDKSAWDDLPTVDWEGIEAANVTRIGKTRKSSETWKAKHTALKIIRDDAASDYLGDAVKGEIRKIPKYNFPKVKADTVAEVLTSSRLDITPSAAAKIVETVADAILSDTVEHVTAWAAENVPAAIAWAIADEHSITPYIEYRLRRDAEGLEQTPMIPMTPANLGAVA